ncbi:MAG: glycosyltransferase family 2 protein [bacterium]|nr:glycosyltransferase family 2 protein [bacterium]
MAVIIVNYRSSHLIAPLIQSIRKHTRGSRYQIIVVDNNSRDKDLVSVLGRNVRLIKLKENRGFAAGNNAGIKAVKARYYCLINPDVVLLNDAITILKNNLKGEYGITGPAIYTAEKRQVYPYYRFGDALYEISRLARLERLYQWNYKKHYRSDRFEADWVTGAFFMVKQDVIQEIGLMDEAYFLYSEETDYCWQARKKGWRVLLNQGARVIHLEESSTARISGFRLYYQYRSKLRFIRRYYGLFQYSLLKLFYSLDIIIKMLVRLVFQPVHKEKFIKFYFLLLKEMVKNEI